MKQGKIPLLPVFAKKCKCIQKFRITRTLDRMVTKDLHHKFFIFFPTLINDYTYPAFHIIKTGFVFFSYRDIYIILKTHCYGLTIEKYKIKRYDEKIQKMLEKTLRGGEIAFIKQTEWIRQL